MLSSLLTLFASTPSDANPHALSDAKAAASPLSLEATQNPRLFSLDGTHNMRDLGGYPTLSGKSVKWKKVFRSDDLHKLSPNDLIKLAGIPIKTNIDFRTKTEAFAKPDHPIPSQIHHYSLPVSPGNIAALQNIETGKPELAMEAIYRQLVTDFQENYRQFFEIATNEQNAPLLFHCSAGKDRTGYAAALFLAALDVDREIILNDYMLSAEYVKNKYRHIVEAYPNMAAMMTVKPTYLESAFSLMEQEFGGIERYLVQELQVDIGKLRALYTE